MMRLHLFGTETWAYEATLVSFESSFFFFFLFGVYHGRGAGRGARARHPNLGRTLHADAYFFFLFFCLS